MIPKSILKLDDEDLSLFPSYGDYVSELEKLDNYNFDNLGIKEIYNIYFDYAKILPNNCRTYNKSEFNSFTFYRTRLNINQNKEDISLIETFSNPPTTFCDKNGRANLKFKSVFYCSDNPTCAILESKPKIGDEGFLSVWIGKAESNVKAGYCLPNYLPKESLWSYVAKDILEHNMKSRKMSKSKFRHLMLLDRFIAHKFVNEHKPYSLTSMISNELLYGDDLWRDFIVYPSISTNINMCNMAFHPNSVIQNLNFDKVIQYKIEDINKEQIKFLLGKTGILKKNKIVWRSRSENETKLFTQ